MIWLEIYVCGQCKRWVALKPGNLSALISPSTS